MIPPVYIFVLSLNIIHGIYCESFFIIATLHYTTYHIIGDIERVGDHIENIAELAQYKADNDLFFTAEATKEMLEMYNLCEEAFRTSLIAYKESDETLARQVLRLEDEVDVLEKQNRTNHIYRLNQRLCNTGAGIIFLDAINNL